MVFFMQEEIQIFKKKVLRFPRLDTILMIEKALRSSKGEFSVREVWQKLPKKVMWQTYIAALDYLEYSGKIIVDHENHPIWIWAPKEIARLEKKKLLIK